MNSRAPDIAASVTAPATKLEPDAIGVVQDTVIGMASSAPAGTVAATLASLAAVAAYSGGLILILTAIPMLIIANLGFLTGWLMITGYLIGTVARWSSWDRPCWPYPDRVGLASPLGQPGPRTRFAHGGSPRSRLPDRPQLTGNGRPRYDTPGLAPAALPGCPRQPSRARPLLPNHHRPRRTQRRPHRR